MKVASVGVIAGLPDVDEIRVRGKDEEKTGLSVKRL
jgi:hypothetical protein